MLAVMMLGIVWFWGCAHDARESQPSPLEVWRQKAEQSGGYSPSARERSIALQPKQIETVGGTGSASAGPARDLPDGPVTLKMHLAEVPVLLRALARAVDLNIMINESVTGRLSINVNNAPWNQVFVGVLKSQGLDYDWEGEILRIVTIEDRERDLKNLEAEERILAKRRELEIRAPLVTTIIPVDFSSAERLRENVSRVISAEKAGEPVGTVMVDTHTNSLIVQATPSDIDRIIPMIKALDRPTPQIHIEAHIVETTSSTARELGVQWGGLYHNSSRGYWISPNATGAVGGQQPGSGQGINPPAGTGINFPANLSNATTEGAGLFLGLIAEGSSGLLALQLSALEEEGMLNILSSPSITTLDNTKAVIESGDEVPIPVVLSDSSNVIYKEALLSLEVTPYVIQEDVLKLEIMTTKNEVDFSRTVLTYPTIVTKKAATNVILFDGQTTVIGGLKKNTTQNSEAGVPWIRKVPLLGHLFKSTGKSEEMQELLIFITPHILKPRPAAAEKASPSGKQTLFPETIEGD
ncbi:type IV pilus secretin PilQ [Desulfatitalea alkaliphila]|uniref:Type IV pilus secretin PilQ n=1 Tax=Desulfatitalea alkaliphila TaxID=2929485 RepID=A0AA41R516_9BACT|nr:type IV pilus secretin PilQ [Desulfatitalea alkaliphila]MCJ8501982.1 type IV pilus secretin PilQ [Desulfatitalea alkaliphila]